MSEFPACIHGYLDRLNAGDPADGYCAICMDVVVRRLRFERDEARALYARAVPFGPHTHAGVWISDEDANSISRDGP